MNLTHQSYFNLTGSKRDILDHELMLNANRFTPMDQGSIPISDLAVVKGTPMDF